MRFSLILLPLLLLLVAACATSDGSGIQSLAATDCVCGQDESDLYGCPCELCAHGQHNPANPLCVCGALGVELTGGEGAETTMTSVSGTRTGTNLLSSSSVVLKNGNTVKGWVTRDDEKNITIKLAGGMGEVEQSYDNLHPRTIYRLKLGRVEKDNGQDQLDLADYATANDLFDVARRHYLEAMKIDQGLEDKADAGLANVANLASAATLDKARQAQEKGDVLAAERYLNDVVQLFPDETAAADASKMLASMEQQTREAREAQASDSVDGIPEDLHKELDSAIKHYERGVEHVSKGQAVADKTSESIRRYEAATKSFASAQRSLDSVKKRHKNEPDTVATLERLDGVLKNQHVDAFLNLATVYMNRSSFRTAAKTVEQALKVDPESTSAKTLLARIEQEEEAAANWKWGERRGGRYGRRLR